VGAAPPAGPRPRERAGGEVSVHGTRTVWISYDSKGCSCVEASVEAGAEVVGIVTLPKDARALVVSPGDFERVAARLGAELIETRHVNHAACVERVRRLAPDVIFVVGWSQLLGSEMIGVARTGVFNIHPTMLPKHRGRAPVVWTILSGLARTAVTLHEISDERADSGPIVGRIDVAVSPRETATTLYAKLALAHAELVRTWLPAIFAGSAPRVAQDEGRSSWWHKRVARDALIDWHMRASRVDEWVRAHTRPFGGAFTFAGDRKLTIWGAEWVSETGSSTPPGTVCGTYRGGAVVQCGAGELLIKEAELDGVRLHGRGWQDLPNHGSHVLG
jgi:methionyl-tRNA formyltransferase